MSITAEEHVIATLRLVNLTVKNTIRLNSASTFT